MWSITQIFANLTIPIQHFEVTPLGTLFVSTDDGVATLDQETGEVIWSRRDIKGCKPKESTQCNFLGKKNTTFSTIANTNFGLFQVGRFRAFDVRERNPFERYAVVDLETGSTIWDSLDLPIEKTKAFQYIPWLDQFMLAGETKDKRGVVVALRGTDGEVLWQRDIDYLDRFKFVAMPDDSRVLLYGRTNSGDYSLISVGLMDGSEHWRLEGVLQRDARDRAALLLPDTDATAILYFTKDGPFRFRLDNGEVLWRVDDWDEEPPYNLGRSGGSSATMVLDGDLLFVPNGKKVDALRVRDGSRVWRVERDFGIELVDLRIVSRGLLVRARTFDLLDPTTGRSLWADRTDRFPWPTALHVDTDAIYLAAEKAFSSVDLATGRVTELAKYDFHGDRPTQMETTEGSFLLMSRQNLLRLNGDGAAEYHTYLKAPGVSGWQKFGRIAASAALTGLSAAGAATAVSPGSFYTYRVFRPTLSAQYGSTIESPKSYFMYTEQPAAGREGFSLVRVDKASGVVTGRLWLDERDPSYSVDSYTETVFYQTTDYDLGALRFQPDPH